MVDLKFLRTAAIIKALKEQRLTNRDIMDLLTDNGLDGLAALAGMEVS